MPAKAGIQYAVTSRSITAAGDYWIPAFAGMTAVVVGIAGATLMVRRSNDLARTSVHLHMSKSNQARSYVLAALMRPSDDCRSSLAKSRAQGRLGVG